MSDETRWVDEDWKMDECLKPFLKYLVGVVKLHCEDEFENIEYCAGYQGGWNTTSAQVRLLEALHAKGLLMPPGEGVEVVVGKKHGLGFPTQILYITAGKMSGSGNWLEVDCLGKYNAFALPVEEEPKE